MSANPTADQIPSPSHEEPEAYEAPCIEDVDTEGQPAATAAMVQTLA